MNANLNASAQRKNDVPKAAAKTEGAPACRVLLAEDDREMRALLALSLQKSGYDVVECPDGVDMLTHLAAFLLPNEYAHEDIDLIISDIRMPGVSGMEVLEGRPEKTDFPPMILITAFGDEETHALAARYGAAGMFDKPFDIDELMAKVADILPLEPVQVD